MSESVKVVASKSGEVITVSKNPEVGYIMVKQSRNMFNAQGWLEKTSVCALIHGKIKDLKGLDFKVGQELPGSIIVKERLYPFNKQNPDSHLKIAGDTGIVCSVNGESIYRKAFYTQDSTLSDELIEHDNKEEIREAILALEDNDVDLNS